MTDHEIAQVSMLIAGLGVLIAVSSAAWTIYYNLRSTKETIVITHGDTSAIINFVEHLQQYLTVFSLDLMIVNASRTQTITVANYWLEVPWKDESLRALPDPNDLGDGESSYRFPCSELEYRRADVINHRRLGQGMLAPGQTISGTFLVQGTAEIPSDLYGPRPIPVTVVALDAKGKQHRSKNTFVVPVKSFPGVIEPLPPNVRAD